MPNSEVELIEGLQATQTAIKGDQLQMLAGVAMLNAMGARMPNMRRAFAIMLEESHDHERAIAGAIRALGSGHENRFAHAIASLDDPNSAEAREALAVH